MIACSRCSARAATWSSAKAPSWFASSQLGESKDNVLIRSDGQPTYFATDIAYHYDKFREREFDRVIDIWGADHQGQHLAPQCRGRRRGRRRREARRGCSTSSSRSARGDEVVPLSKRAGEIVTLREVVEEVGADATRYFFLASSPRSPIDFDLELAKQQSRREPRLLRAVRARPPRKHPAASRRAAPQRRGRRSLAASTRSRAGAVAQPAAAARGGRAGAGDAGAPPPPALRPAVARSPSTSSTRSARSSTTTTRRSLARACCCWRRRAPCSRACSASWA